ncbi:MAG: Flp family type IVb pilin [Candidatus Riflebacteria bacterium]|nr:Flp family type IVb pilin [Candidatus Riflebacteria bacterium]
MPRRAAEPKDDDRGQGLAEYGLILAFMVLFAIGFLSGFGSSTNNIINRVSGSLTTVS